MSCVKHVIHVLSARGCLHVEKQRNVRDVTDIFKISSIIQYFCTKQTHVPTQSGISCIAVYSWHIAVVPGTCLTIACLLSKMCRCTPKYIQLEHAPNQEGLTSVGRRYYIVAGSAP